MGLLDRAKDAFREKTRDKVFAALKRMRVPAELAESGRHEENLKCGFGIHSLGIIDIEEGLVRWVNVRIDLNEVSWIDYAVPDERLSHSGREILIQAHFEKRLFGLGKVINLVWRGEDSGLGIVGRLNGDIPLKNTLMGAGIDDFTITFHDKPGCWLISVAYTAPPDKALWGCYQSIAEHLLSERV